MNNEGIKALFKETFEGPEHPEKDGSWFTESEQGSGLFGTIESLSAEKASVAVNGVSIAAHTDHTRYHLWGNNQLLKNNEQDMNWNESWEITEVSEDGWKNIIQNFKEEYNQTIKFIDDHQDMPSETYFTFFSSIITCSISSGRNKTDEKE